MARSGEMATATKLAHMIIPKSAKTWCGAKSGNRTRMRSLVTCPVCLRCDTPEFAAEVKVANVEREKRLLAFCVAHGGATS